MASIVGASHRMPLTPVAPAGHTSPMPLSLADITDPEQLRRLAAHQRGRLEVGAVATSDQMVRTSGWLTAALFAINGGGAIAALKVIDRVDEQVDSTLAATNHYFPRTGHRSDAGRLSLFDAVPLADWRTDTCDLPLTVRLDELAALVRAGPMSGVALLPWSVAKAFAKQAGWDVDRRVA